MENIHLMKFHWAIFAQNNKQTDYIAENLNIDIFVATCNSSITIPNGFFSTKLGENACSNGTCAHGAKLVYVCEEDYIMNGSAVTTCRDDTWEPSLGSCVLHPNSKYKII